MRVLGIIFAAILGMAVGDILGQPESYWHGQRPQEVERWACFTGSGGAIGAIVAMLLPTKRNKRRQSP